MKNYIIMVIGAIVLAGIPILNLPLMWYQTFFHEFNHAIGAWLSGGGVLGLNMSWTSSGWVMYKDVDNHFLVQFIGYFGAPLWGALIFLVARDGSDKLRSRLIVILALIISIFSITYAADTGTLLISAFLVFMLIVLHAHKDLDRVVMVMEFLGIYIMLNAIHFPLYILDDGDRLSDGVRMALLSGLPEMLIILVWWLTAVSCLIAVAWFPYNLGKRVT